MFHDVVVGPERSTEPFSNIIELGVMCHTFCVEHWKAGGWRQTCALASLTNRSSMEGHAYVSRYAEPSVVDKFRDRWRPSKISEAARSFVKTLADVSSCSTTKRPF